MFKLFGKIILLLLIASAFYAHSQSQSTFQAKFESVDGLPLGAPVTALGVKVGKVISTKPTKDGVLVKVKITNKSVPKPPPGSRLSITSFTPAGGRVLEIKLPDGQTKDEAWLVQEPVSADSWLHASFEIVGGIQHFSSKAIGLLTPENVNKARLSVADFSNTLDSVATNLRKYEKSLSSLEEDLSDKSEQAKQLVNLVRNSVDSLNQVIGDDEFIESFNDDSQELASNLGKIAKAVEDPNFVNNTKEVKSEVIDSLNNVSSTLTAHRRDLGEAKLGLKLQDFNKHVDNLNEFYEGANKKYNRETVKAIVKNTKNDFVELSESTKSLDRVTSEKLDD